MTRFEVLSFSLVFYSKGHKSFDQDMFVLPILTPGLEENQNKEKINKSDFHSCNDWMKATDFQ